MNILAMDTTAKASSVSLLNDDKILAEFSLNMQFMHSQTIMPMCESMLNCCKMKLDEIDAFAVSTGPGSFTGLRIGLSAIKGMAYALSKPCVGVSTLDALAMNVSCFDGIICAVMDARCKQVYTALYKVNTSGVNPVEKLTADRAITLAELLLELQQINEKIILVGDGAQMCYDAYKDSLDISLAQKNVCHQRASSVGLVALQKIVAEGTISVDKLLPEYLRLPQAQRELNAKLAL